MPSSQEQYQAIKQAVVGFRSGLMSLADLIEQLPALLNDLGDIDPMWREEYVGYWWTLEQIHGEAIDLGEAQRLPQGSRQTVDDALDGLERLVDGALRSNAG